MRTRTRLKVIAIMLSIVFMLQAMSQNVLLAIAEEIKEVFTTEKAETEFEVTPLPDITDSNKEAYIIGENVLNRTKYSKEYVMSNGTIQVHQFAEAIHYEEGGEYKEIDNTLEEKQKDGVTYYENKANSFKVKFNKEINSERSLVEITESGYGIKIGYFSEAETKETGLSTEKEKIEGTSKELQKVTTNNNKITYANLQVGANIEYEIVNDRLINNIIITELQKGYEYVYEIETENLSLSLNEQGEVVATDKLGEEKYVMSMPMMTDAEGNRSNLVTTKLSQGKGNSYELTITADEKWISRAKLPVSISPELTKKQEKLFTYKTITKGVEEEGKELYVGSKGNNGLTNAYVEIELEERKQYHLESAILNVTYEKQGTKGALWVDVGLVGKESRAQEETEANLISYENFAETKKSEIEKKYHLEREDLLDGTIGLTFSASELGTETGSYVTMSTNSISTIITYTFKMGIDSRFSLESFAIEGATAYVNNLSGELSAVIDVASVNTLGKKNLNASLIYNPYYDNILQSLGVSEYFGNNFKLNYQQHIVEVDDGYLYIDGDGSITIFDYASGQYYKAKDKNLNMHVNGTQVTILDESKNKLVFKNGRLSLISSLISNDSNQYVDEIKIEYEKIGTTDTDKITSITYHKEGAIESTYSISFDYLTENNITRAQKIKTKKGNSTLKEYKLEYDSNNNLTGIKNLTEAVDANNYYSYKLDYDTYNLLNEIYNNTNEGLYATFYVDLTYGNAETKVYEAQGDLTQGRGNYRTYNYTSILGQNGYSTVTTTQDSANVTVKNIVFGDDGRKISEWTSYRNGDIVVNTPSVYQQKERENVSAVIYDINISNVSYTSETNTSLQTTRTLSRGSSITGTATPETTSYEEQGNYVYGLGLKISNTSDIDVMVEVRSGGQEYTRSIAIDDAYETYFVVPCAYSENISYTIMNKSSLSSVNISNVSFARLSRSDTTAIYDSTENPTSDFVTARTIQNITHTEDGEYIKTVYDNLSRVDYTESNSNVDTVKTTTTYDYPSEDNLRNPSSVDTKRNNETISTIEYFYTKGIVTKKTETYGDIKYETSYSLTAVQDGTYSESITEGGITTTNKYGISGGDNRLIETRQGYKKETYTYDSYGNVKTIQVYDNSNSSSSPVMTQTNTYTNGNLISTSISGNTTTIGYESTGLPSTISTNGQTALTYAYDEADGGSGLESLRSITYGNGQVLDYEYGNGSVTLRYRSSSTTGYIDSSYTYYKDNKDRIEEATSYSSDGNFITYRYEYLDYETIRSFNASGSGERSFRYRENYDIDKGRITDYTIGLVKTGCYTDNYTGSYSYDYRNRITESSFDNAVTTYTYDDANRLTSYQRKYLGNTIDSKTISYQTISYQTINGCATDRVTAISDSNARYTTTALYNSNGYVNKLTYNEGEHEYTYDGIGRLTSEEIDGTTYSYTYDNANQILTASNQSYTYDSTTKRLSYITKNGINQYFRYDNLGNPVLYKGNGATQPANFVWKQGRELVSGTLNNKNFSYSYDTNGMRYNKVVDNKRTEYYLDGTKILGENRIGHGGVILYIYDETGIAGMIYNGSYYYYEKNVLGDVVAVLDINNNEVASYTYDAWGNVISQSGSMADKNPIRYRGYYYDTETGFYYLQSRYYDPSIRRFINADDHSIIGALSQSAGEINLYAYCCNNPVMYIDPTGHFGLGALLAITLSSFIIGGISQFVSNALVGKEGSELLSGVAGAAFGTALNSLLLCLAIPLGSLSFVLAAGASSLAQTGIDSLEAVIREEEFDWGQSMINLGVNFLSTLSGNILGSKVIITSPYWFQPKYFSSVFTKSYGQKILMQTVIGSVVSASVNFTRAIGPKLLRRLIQQ